MPSYRIRNWPEYNRALKNRGNLTLWVSDDAIAKWLNSDHTCEKGRPRIYSDDAILCALMVRDFVQDERGLRDLQLFRSRCAGSHGLPS